MTGKKTTVVNLHYQKAEIDISRRGHSLWGNPHKLRKGASEEERIRCILKYCKEFTGMHLDLVDLLQGKTLGCWCKPAHCHGDVLARLADVPKEEREALLERIINEYEGMLSRQIDLFGGL